MEKGISPFLAGTAEVDPPKENLQVNDVVIVKEDDMPRNQWRVCRVVEVLPDEDGLVRKVKLEVGSQNLT